MAEALERLVADGVTAEEFETRVLKADSPMVVFFWARWCEPCRRMAPVVAGLARRYEGRFRLAAVDTDEHEDLAQQQAVAALPTTVLYRKGEVLERFVGVFDEGLGEAVEAALRKAVH